MDQSTSFPPPLPEADPEQSPGGRPKRYSEPRVGIGVTIVQSCLIAGCVTVFVPILLTVGFFVMTYFLVTSGMGEDGGGLDAIVSPGSPSLLRQKLIRPGDQSSGIIAIVTVHGAIGGGGSPLEGEGTLAFVSEQLRAAGEDERIKAVVLQIDSPGGGLTASDQLHNEVVKLKGKGKRVIAWAGGMMASGGYYVAVGTEGVMASPTSTVGSIGVIMQHFQVGEMLRKLGIATDPILSGDRKDVGSPFREMTPEERAYLQAYIDAAHKRFVDIVAEGRGMDRDAVAKLADGGIFTAQSALENGLVDRIGYIDDALAWAEEMAGAKNMRVISYRRPLSVGDLFREMGQGAAGAVVEAATPEPAPRAMALWEGSGTRNR